MDRLHPSFEQRQAIIQLFVHAVDNELLVKFMDRIRKELCNRLNDERIKFSQGVSAKQFSLDPGLLYEYNCRMSEFMVVLELIADFIKRPYCPLSEECLQVRSLLHKDNDETLGKFFKKKITEKGFTLAEQMSHNMLTKIGFFSLVSGGNLVLLLGGLAVSKSFELLASFYKEFELVDRIR